jgi:serine/threonine protein kinase
MAPEVYAKQKYDARLADVWSLGVMLFIILTGKQPYKHPTDREFRCLTNGQVGRLLRQFNRLCWITPHAYDLLTKIFLPAGERINMKKLRQHPFVQLDPSDENQLIANEERKSTHDDDERKNDSNAQMNAQITHNKSDQFFEDKTRRSKEEESECRDVSLNVIGNMQNNNLIYKANANANAQVGVCVKGEDTREAGPGGTG